MFSWTRIPLLGGLLLLLLFVAPGLQAAEGFRVLVSVKPVHSIVAALMQDIEGPDLLIDGAQTPYEYHPDAALAERLAEYDLVVWVGPELEGSLASTLGQAPEGTRVIDVLSSSRLKILPSRHDDNARDPYFWLDNRNIIMLAEDLALLFQEMDPVRSHIYKRNLRKLDRRLEQMDREYEYGYRGLKAAPALQYHDTLQYFEQAYALAVLGRVTGSPRDAADTQRLLGVRSQIAAGEVSCLLTESGLATPHLGLLTDNSGVTVAQLDSLGTGLQPGPDLYFDLMQNNTDRIKRCLDPAAGRHAAMEEAAVLSSTDSDGRFLLTDTRGRLVSDADLRGKHHILYFGYTFCPDICPTSLAVLGRAMKMLGDRAENLQPWFVTIDPQRDTIEVLREYVAYFDQRLVGLAGKKEMIDRLAARFGVQYEKVVEEGRDPDLYIMDHSASLYLIGPDGRYITKFLHGISPTRLHAELSKHLP